MGTGKNLTFINAFVIICEAIPTMFFVLETSFLDEENFAGPAFAEAVIHSIKRKPEKSKKPIHQIFATFERVPF